MFTTLTQKRRSDRPKRLALAEIGVDVLAAALDAVGELLDPHIGTIALRRAPVTH